MSLTRHSSLLFAGLLLVAPAAQAQRFFPDDPLIEEPPPVDTVNPRYRALSEVAEYFENFYVNPGERHPPTGVISAIGSNTLGEVLDGPWYVNRHARDRLSHEELARAAGDRHPPSRDAPWRVLTVKRTGVRPGLRIVDAAEREYLLVFDPHGHLELATGAQIVSAAVFHALGYWVAEDHIVYFQREQLVASGDGQDFDSMGRPRRLIEDDIDFFLEGVSRDRTRGYRAVAIAAPPGTAMLGSFQLYGTRSDDPNDVVPHEHRRDLRGLSVFAAWLNHTSLQAVNTGDVLVEEDGVAFIRHYLLDHFRSLGAGWNGPKEAWEGFEPRFRADYTFRNLAGLGVASRRWTRARHSGLGAVGTFECDIFDPEAWYTEHDLAPFANALPDDQFWAAKQAMVFTDEDLQAIVAEAEYSDPRAADWIAGCLAARRDAIGRVYFDRVLPLDDFRIEEGRLQFDDLGVEHGFVASREYDVRWSSFDNDRERHTPLEGADSLDCPPRVVQAGVGAYFAARITAGELEKGVTVYVVGGPSGPRVVGVERDWPGKRDALAAERDPRLRNSYPELRPEQRRLFDRHTALYNAHWGRDLTPKAFFDTLTMSERTTFEAVTHALLESELTDEEGGSLGNALALVDDVHRIAGQYHGKRGDEQFRVYCAMTPEAKETLYRSREFRRGRDNDVFHIGYPVNFRQYPKSPSIQISMSEDGTRADIDVDYRSSGFPSALFNGHLTAANSDVRAGPNHRIHKSRWVGLTNWWQELWGELTGESKGSPDMLVSELPEKITPVPPNRPSGARIDELEDAVQEFLTDWLVRRDYDEAMEFISERSDACVGAGERAGRRAVRDALEEVSDELGEVPHMGAVMQPLKPWKPEYRVFAHAFDREFSLFELSDFDAVKYLCESRRSELAEEAARVRYGTYYGALLSLELPSGGAGALRSTWSREDGDWRLLSWDLHGN